MYTLLPLGSKMFLNITPARQIKDRVSIQTLRGGDRRHKTPQLAGHGGRRMPGVQSFSLVEFNLVLGMCYRKCGLVDSMGTLSLEGHVLCERVFTQWRMRKWFMKQLSLRCVVLTGYTAQNEEAQRKLGREEGSLEGKQRLDSSPIHSRWSHLARCAH